jgi:hypothetical protein
MNFFENEQKELLMFHTEDDFKEMLRDIVEDTH